jgi:hypothetical protein
MDILNIVKAGEIMVGTDASGGGPEDYPMHATSRGWLILDHKEGKLLLGGDPMTHLLAGCGTPSTQWVDFDGELTDESRQAIGATRQFLYGDEEDEDYY